MKITVVCAGSFTVGRSGARSSGWPSGHTLRVGAHLAEPHSHRSVLHPDLWPGTRTRVNRWTVLPGELSPETGFAVP